MANPTVPFTDWGAEFFKDERQVNGIWNHLIFKHFAPDITPGSNFVSPEAYPRLTGVPKLRTDLLVSKLAGTPGAMTTSSPVLVFEGKGDNGDAFDKLEDQLVKWLAEAAIDHDVPCWAIGARGGDVRFYAWNNTLVPQQWDNTSVKLRRGNKTYAYSGANDWSIVNFILHHMKTIPLTTNNVKEYCK